LVVLAIGLKSLPPGPPLRVPDRAWFAEAVLLSLAVAVLLLSLTLTAGDGPTWLLLAGAGALLLGGWWRLPVSGPVRHLLRTPGETGPHLALAHAAAAIGVVFFIIPFFLQHSLGASVSAAGLVLLGFPAGMALTGPVGGFLGDWWGWRRTAALGATLFTAGLALLVPMSHSWGIGDTAWRLFLAGCGNGLFNAPNMAMAMSNAPPTRLATTGATTSLARQAGFALGPALATLAWSISSYRPAGMTAVMVLATALSAMSVFALVRRRSSTASNPPESPVDGGAAVGDLNPSEKG
jgi:predicted MFS family arabinose efflux permease